MLDKQSTSTESAPVWRILRFFGLDNRGDKESPTADKRAPREPEDRKHQFAIWYFFAAFLGVMLIQHLWVQYTQIETIPYSQFEQLLDQNKISEVLVGSDTIQGTLKEPFPDGRKLFGETTGYIVRKRQRYAIRRHHDRVHDMHHSRGKVSNEPVQVLAVCVIQEVDPPSSGGV